MKKLSVILVFTAIALISCFMPINDEIVFAVEDNRNPQIVISSPKRDSIYMSTVTIKGYVKDDSQESGDNKGALSSLSVEAASNPDHRGRIKIDSDGSYTIDTDFGGITRDNFIYTHANKGFTIKIDTNDWSQTMFIVITAIDRNDNETKETLRLQRSEGPFMELDEDYKYYLIDRAIDISGKLANSNSQKDSYDELKSLTLQILGNEAKLDIEGGTRNGDLIQKSPLEGFKAGSYLNYDVSKRKFAFHLLLFATQKETAILNISISAEDKSGNTTYLNKSLTRKSNLDPTIHSDLLVRDYYFSALSPTSGGPAKPFYAPATSDTSSEMRVDTLSLNGLATANTGAERISELKLEFANTLGTQVVSLPTNPDPTIRSSSFAHSVNLGSNNLNSGAGDTTITLFAKDNANRTSEKVWLVQEDSAPPVFSNFSISASTNHLYVGHSSTVTLGFTVRDVKTGVDFSKLSGTVAGINLESRHFQITRNTGVCSVAVSLTDATAISSSIEDLSISISVSDKIGNTRSIDAGSFDRVQFLQGPPTLTSIGIASNNTVSTSIAKRNDTVILSVNSTQPLDPNQFEATIAGVAASVDQSSPAKVLTARVTIPTTYSTSPIPFEITAFSNAIGTAGTAPISSTTDGSSVILYTEGPYLTIGQVNGVDKAYIQRGNSFSLSVTSNQPLSDTQPTVIITPTNSSTIAFAQDRRSFTVVVNSFTGSSDARIAISISGASNVVGISQRNRIRDEQLNAWYYPGRPTLNAQISLSKGVGNSGKDPEVGDKVALEFSVVNDRVLQAEPTVELTLSGNALSVTKDGTVSHPDYRYTYTIVSDDISGSKRKPVEYTINFTDMAGNVGNPDTGTSSFKLRPAP
ncbi:hypothetical protein JY97_11125 [Alkalispirochaeta odontotermitis]|nr:hypothetical protein JY97_11125 [Alkalispirochaeta odontotermitis]